MELLMVINVKTYDIQTVEGTYDKVVMIPFSAETDGELFRGKTIENGVDTQHISPDGSVTLSARYMLVGRDRKGNECRVFIENCGDALDNCRPNIVTDSPELSFLETEELVSMVEPCEGGVTVRIFR